MVQFGAHLTSFHFLPSKRGTFREENGATSAAHRGNIIIILLERSQGPRKRWLAQAHSVPPLCWWRQLQLSRARLLSLGLRGIATAPPLPKVQCDFLYPLWRDVLMIVASSLPRNPVVPRDWEVLPDVHCSTVHTLHTRGATRFILSRQEMKRKESRRF